jgi:tripartite-type tricarboxylate transporter receptor subunit TctC
MPVAVNLTRRAFVATTTASLGALVNAQSGSAYPSRPVRLVVVFPAGGGTDVAARIVSPKLAERLKQPVVVENKPGQGGGIGLDMVAKSPPDGYTLVLASSGGLTALPSLFKNLPFNPEKDFVPITTFGISPLVLVAGATSPFHSVRDIIAQAKKEPGKLTYGSGGNGTAPHLSGELFKAMTGTDIVHVPYKGSGPALVAVMGNEIPLAFADMATVRPLLGSGRLKAIGVLGKTRSTTAPDVPTLAESGLPGYESEGWFAILAPAGTPAAIANRLNAELVAILSSEEIRTRFATAALEPAYCKPAELAQLIKRDSDKWSKLIRANGITAE